ncbi:MAG TPA: ABC transporter permease [Vicinamibacteria bacterium]|nr:ABC transporter permease [Vicinamibacteria bacterium]
MSRHTGRKPFWYLGRGPRTVRDDVDEEIRVHLEMRAEELRAEGLPLAEARREALRRFGDLEATRRYCRGQDERKETDMRRGLMLQDLGQDVRISLRSLLRVPVLTLTVLITVGLGIGATTVVFSAINAALLRPLPYAEPDRLVWIYTDSPPFEFRFSVADYLALEAQQTQFDRVAGFTNRTMAFSDGDAAELLSGRVVSWTYLGLLGVRPALGRDFTEMDGQPGRPPTVMVSHGFWQQRLGGRRDAIGGPIRLDGADYTLVGVLPPTVGPLERGQAFFIVAQLGTPPRRGPFPYWVLGRLRPGVDPSAAASELRAINRRLFPIWRASYQDEKATWSLMDLKARLVGDVHTTAGLALAAVALVWLIACANASNLLVARVTSRRSELAVRAALGASRGRVVRHLLVESGLLAVGAAVIGWAFASIGIELMQGAGASYFPRTQEIRFDGPVLWVLAAATLVSGSIFGLVPALYGTGGAIDESLRSGGRSATGSLSVRRFRQVLVGGQFAIATPLLVVAGLLLVSLAELREVDLGFDGRNMITGSLRLPAALYETPARVTTYWVELTHRLEALPGVSGVAFADSRPPSSAFNINNFDLEDLPTAAGGSQPATPWVAVTPEYFRVLGLPLLEGRFLDERDGQRPALESVVVDRAWAERFFPGRSALGKRFKEGGCTECPWTTVVGVVGDVKYVGLDQPDQGTVYAPLAGQLSRFVVLRTKGDPLTMLPSVRRLARELDPTVPLTSVATIDELVAQSLEAPRSLSALVAGLALVALVLSVVGIYGVMAYYVQQHAKDISIRVALGGSSARVLWLVIGRSMTVVLGGVVAGLLAAFASTRLLSSLLFNVGAADAATFLAVSLFLLAVALVACFVPARRAASLQPAAILRNE